MFFELLKYWFPEAVTRAPLQVFGYTSVRAAGALALALILSLIFGPFCIRRLTQLKLGQQVRRFETEETKQFNIHQHKAGTPTMGGVLIIFATLVSALVFCVPSNPYVWAVMGIMVGAGILGFADDYYKVARKNHKGVSGKTKLAVQAALGLALGVYLTFSGSHTFYTLFPGGAKISGDTCLVVPFLKHLYPCLGIFFILWTAFVITATSNAVNLTDGLDGLAIGSTIIVVLPYLAIAYLVSRFDFANYLYVPHVPAAGELSVFLAALFGASLGFLWFNAHPAQVFMGDTGSLSLGAVIGSIAVLTKHELLLVLVGGVFVVEALSVMVQVSGYKWTGKRVLRMSPLHNHFVKLGMNEAKIIARFAIVSILLALAGLSTLKLR